HNKMLNIKMIPLIIENKQTNNKIIMTTFPQKNEQKYLNLKKIIKTLKKNNIENQKFTIKIKFHLYT
ncbi:hypothetical protein Q4519_21935, partial [Motilimonas sp. 1_MG-2023]|uniref:hypothetical protein n=1 Tax=Motilimonas sp. 1_MG-2023 TaxID=3062672 RepID=UPI0026E22835